VRFEINKQSRNKSRLKRLCQQGFTLVELLVALAITGIVISLTGSGLYALMMADRRSQIETTERLELERALAFITDEIKMSRQVMTSIPLLPNGTTHFQSASGSSRVQPILILSPAPSSGLTNPIVYYLADPPNSSVWLGPRVIYRWGPTLLQNGNYSDGDGRDLTRLRPGSPVEYYNEVVVDRLSDVASAQASISCESSYSYPVPALTARLGFYACIAPDQKAVKLWMYKQQNTSAKSQSVNALVVTRSN
jgi:prepilin-type N-terminal cleavage/methylation domain-containing protein